MREAIEVCKDLFGSAVAESMTDVNIKMTNDVINFNDTLGWKALTITRVDGRRKSYVRISNLITGEVSPVTDVCTSMTVDIDYFTMPPTEIRIGMGTYTDVDGIRDKLESYTKRESLETLIVSIWEKRRNVAWGGIEELTKYAACRHPVEGLWNDFFVEWIDAFNALEE